MWKGSWKRKYSRVPPQKMCPMWEIPPIFPPCIYHAKPSVWTIYFSILRKNLSSIQVLTSATCGHLQHFIWTPSVWERTCINWPSMMCWQTLQRECLNKIWVYSCSMKTIVWLYCPPPSRLADNEFYIYKIIIKLFAYPGGQCRHYRGLNKPKTSQSSKVHLLMKKIIMNIT